MPRGDLRKAWIRELTQFGVWLLIWGGIGLFIGSVLGCLLLASLLYLAWHLAYVYQLHYWLIHFEDGEAPEGSGVWVEIFRDFYRLQRRHKGRERHLSRVLREFEESTAALPDGGVVLDPEGRIVWFNEAAASLLGLRHPQDHSQRIVNLVRHPAFTGYFVDGEYNQAVEVPSPLNHELPLSLRIIPYGEGQRLLIVRDVSAMKQLEQTRRDFAANASHELRTPLTVLRGYLDMLRDEAQSAGKLSEWRRAIDEMCEQSERMAEIIEDLLTLAKLESRGREAVQAVVDVQSMMQSITDEARQLSDGAHEITCHAEHGLSLYGHKSELYSAFSNLVFNAVQYTPAGGSIELRWWADADGVYFSVEDSGIGIEAKHIPRITQRFYRVDPGRARKAGGSGLGLAIVKHVMEHHEGSLHVASELNVGSTFTCRFPLHRAQRRDAA